jgi:hypothetical protein
MASRNRGRPHARLADLGSERLSQEEFSALINAFSNAPPIVAAIIGAGLVEHELDEALRDRIARKDDETWENMTGENGPFNTFWAKIQAGYALKIYNARTRKNLTVIQKIRNGFAHTRRLLDFEHDLVLKELKRIEIPTSARGREAGFLTTAQSIKRGGRSSYVILCCTIISILARHSAKKSQARLRYYTRKSAKWRAANPLMASIADQFLQPKSTAGFPEGPPGHQSVDPSAPVRGLIPLSSLGQLLVPPRKKDKLEK